MDSDFTYGVLHTPSAELPAAVTRIRAHRPWLALLGGRGIGWATDEIPVILSPGQGLDGLTGATPLTPTVRPTDDTPPQPKGAVAPALVLIATRYASLSEWERSRQAISAEIGECISRAPGRNSDFSGIC